MIATGDEPDEIDGAAARLAQAFPKVPESSVREAIGPHWQGSREQDPGVRPRPRRAPRSGAPARCYRLSNQHALVLAESMLSTTGEN